MRTEGTSYVRWGSKSCPSPAQLVYSGYVGGYWFDHTGAAVNYLCLPQKPVFDSHKIPPALNSHNHVQELYGAEFQVLFEQTHDSLPACTACHVPKSSTVMIPATDVCIEGWTQEYHGYLMAETASTKEKSSVYNTKRDGAVKDNFAEKNKMDCAEFARNWEIRFQNLQDELRESRKRMEKQSEMIAELVVQGQQQRDQLQKQKVHISTLLKFSKKSEELSGTAQGMVTVSGSFENSTKGKRQPRSDDMDSLELVVNQLGTQVETLSANIQALQNWVDDTERTSGTTYVRWGSKSCPIPAQLVYSGYIGGSWFDQPGGAVNYLCLPNKPEFDNHRIPPVVSSHNHVQELYGAEYQAFSEQTHDSLPACTVCHVPKSSTVMIPATDVCMEGWTQEYHGYLMAGATTHASGSEYDGKLLYYTVTRCGSLPCPPYVNNKIVTCVVCSR
ncbi:hypothetical protein ACOMHN_013125 [Nucella lapillus]